MNHNKNSSDKNLLKLASDNNQKSKDFFDADSFILDEDEDPVIHNLLENSFNDENKENYNFDLDKVELNEIIETIKITKNQAIGLIGEKDFLTIYKFYKNLQEVFFHFKK